MTTLTTTLPRDSEGAKIPVLPVRAAGGWGIPVGNVSEAVGPFTAKTTVVTLRAVGCAMWWQLGTGNSVSVAIPSAPFTGGPHYLAAGETQDVALGSTQDGNGFYDHIAAIAVTGTGYLYVSERG